ncbi:HAMP domain-containing sensor histidine kinase [Acrocarpospora sp. B8E8]
MARLTLNGAGTKEGVVCGGVFEEGRCHLVVAQQAHRHQGDWIVYTSAPALAAWVAPEVAATIGGCAIMVIAMATVLGNRIVTASLRPVSAIRTELDAINASCPGRRVPLMPCSNEIHDLAQSINHTLTRLQGAMDEQRRLASDAAHDLKSPIAGIRAEMEDALLAPQETSVPAVGGAILPSLDRLEAIIADLLLIARMDQGTRLVRKPVDLAHLVRGECRAHHQMTHRLVCHFEFGVVVLGDPVRLCRMFTNLLDNADRHAHSTVTVSVRRDVADDGDRARFPRGMAVLEVTDDGPGIDPDKRELVFQRFARLDPAGSTGTGLGLAIARQIAEAKGGTLRIEDSPAGARFVVRLPLCFIACLPKPAD